ncbi:squash isoform 1-T2 [Cochliomyia hominivorax]
MPWVPSTDFEEEIVNLQPHHDFIYGGLSEPQYFYPRPKAHTDYALKRKQNANSNRINGKLHAIQQVQRMASTKPIGEQPTVDDWENNKQIEQETIGMMRYCGMGVSVEQPLNEKVTIATYPVQNTIKMVQNGRRKMVLYFDDNVFKLKEKVSDSSSGFESYNNSNKSEENYQEKDSCTSKEEESINDTSFDNSLISSTSASTSFTTAADSNDTFSSISSSEALSSTKLKAQRLQQYDKLLEETSALTLNSSSSSNVMGHSFNSNTPNLDSFKTAEECSSSKWKPIFCEPENIFEKQENWPELDKNKNLNYPKKNTHINESSFLSISTTTASSSCDGNSSNDSKQSKRVNFLDRFIKTENCDNLNTSTASNSTTTTEEEPKTYANIIKTPKVLKSEQELNNNSNDLIRDFQPFYTTRKMYALKRHVK